VDPRRLGSDAQRRVRPQRLTASPPDGRGLLAVVGTGIALVRQLTPEAREEIELADEVLYVVADSATAAYVETLNPRARSLAALYRPGVHRREIYGEMVSEILAPVRRGERVCAVFYGHPGVLVQPAHEAVRRARAEGHEARMLPGISTEACLVADLGIDPGEHGWQSWEATSFLRRAPRPDPGAALVLWQVDGIGRRDAGGEGSGAGLRALAEALAERYPPEHEVVFYRASPYPVVEADVIRLPLAELGALRTAPAPTLYVPPLTPS
jgi:precorrin-6B methylase 1